MSENASAQSALRELAVPASDVSAITKFVTRNGGSASAVLQPIGAAGVRITLIGASGGVLGDRVVADLDIAKAVAAAVPGLKVEEEWSRELVSTATSRPGHFRKMAGWVANKKY